jgi:hypothetical protein
MRNIVFAAIAAVAISGISPAIAGDGDEPVANTQFAQLPGVVAQASVQSVPSVELGQNGQEAATFATQTNSGVSLFPAHNGGGDNQ